MMRKRTFQYRQIICSLQGSTSSGWHIPCPAKINGQIEQKTETKAVNAVKLNQVYFYTSFIYLLFFKSVLTLIFL